MSAYSSRTTTLAGIFIAALVPFLAVELFPSVFYRVTDITRYLVFHNVAEFFSVMVSMSIFGVGWFTYEQSKDRHALFLSTAFLAIGLMDFMHALGYSGMTPFITPNSANKSTQYWIAVRLFSAAAFLISAFIYPEQKNRWLSSPVLIIPAIIIPLLVFTGITFFPSQIPATFIDGIGLTPFKKVSEAVIIGLMTLAAILYWKRMSRTGNRMLMYFLVALVLCIFSELVFAVYKSVFDTYNVLGHVYKVIAFYLIYKGVFASSVMKPYLELSDTNEKLMEEIIQRSRIEVELRQSEQKFRALVENIPQKIFTKDRNLNFVSCNENFAQDRGLTLEEITGKSDFDFYPPHLAEKYRSDDMRIMESGETEGIEEEYTQNGLDAWVYIVKAPIRDNSGAVMGIMGVFSDITQRKYAEKRLMGAMADLERSNKELEQFAYVASHDLQEPLRMVSSYTQLLAQRYEGQLDDKAQKFINYAVDGAVRMQRLINDLLTYSRITTKGKAFEPIDSHVALEDALQNLSVAIEETGALITSGDLPVVCADATQLSQLFLNLVSNAIKFHGAELPRIHISARETGNEWSFSVKDNGIGIDPQFAEKVFVIFQRLHTRLEYPGTGIGLALCNRIVTRHGGRIWFESEPGKGCTFYFTLPR